MPGLAGRDPGATSPGVLPAPVLPGSNDIRPPVGIPAPVLPTTSIGGGVPAPPFVPPPVGSGPADAANPFDAAKPFEQPNPFATGETRRPARPQEIKIEVGAEAVEAAKAMRKFIAYAGAGGAVIGILIGTVVGQGYANSKRESNAIEGAGMLAQDVEASNAKIDQLNAKIGEAVKEMKARKFPENFVKDLGGISVPFDGGKLVGRGVGSYDRRTLNLLFQYVADVQALNTRKEALQGLFGGQKQAIKNALEQGEKPQIGYTILVTKSQKGPVASIAPLGAPFALGADWPKSLSMNNLVTREKQDIARYEAGDFFSTQEKRVGIPVEPESVAAAFPNDISARVLSELAKTSQLLNGEPGGDGGEASAGVIKNGKELAKALREMGKK
ncbi:MAG TPA: hypothetical protein VFS43_20165 [Polyangiaceae bacterium]|nr:hypothetical protein [Polyangiaceae bacterium]